MKKSRTKSIIVISLVCLFLGSTILPTIMANSDLKHISGFEKGIPWKSYVPMKKITFVGNEEESLVDDLAYLASVPTAVFNTDDYLFTHPLLYYQDKMDIEDIDDRPLDAYPGIEIFMEDWMDYCNDKLDQMTLINVPESKVKQWKTNDVRSISGDNFYQLAKEIALQDWSYSDKAVVAVINEEYQKPTDMVSNKVTGVIQPKSVREEHFEVPQTNQLNPQYKEFNVPEGYNYIMAKTTFASIEYMLFPFSWVVIPAGDKDMQLYCKYNSDWMQVAAASTNTNQWGMDPEAERAKSYVYNSGQWMVGITDIPTEGEGSDIKPTGGLTRHGTWAELLSNMIQGVIYNVDVFMYPGTEIDIPDTPMYECNDVEIRLTWNNPTLQLGFSLIGPSGEEIISANNESRTDYQEIELDELGECMEGECYSISVFTMDSITSPIEFEIEYSWGQRIDKKEGDALNSATQGAVIASMKNAPLLYTPTSKLSKETEDTLYKLGVKEVCLVDIGNHVSNDVIKEIKNAASISKHYIDVEDIYHYVSDSTGEQDIVFTTIDPWSYWFNDDKPEGEKEKALFIGQAAYCAALHGAPLLIVDQHPELSAAVVWHNENWKRHADERVDYHPSVSEMFLTGSRVYNYLKKLGFDWEGMESIITIADHFDIGMSWDRAFVGKATPGRILGTPVDIAYWICRNIFYPQLIFTSPALNENGVKLVNGSMSYRRSILPWGKGGLKIDRPSQEEHYVYPIVHSYTGYMHRFNEMAEKYYGFKYQTANEIIPGETNSLNPIDDGVNLKYRGEAGSFYPDIITSEISPLYCTRGGYSNAFSTNFEITMDNLNRGAILWIRSGHGTHTDCGGTSFWAPNHPESALQGNLAGGNKELNPWRGYDFYLGSTADPDTMTMEVHGVIPALLGNPNMNGILSTGLDWAPAKKPILDKIGAFLSLPILRRIPFFDWLRDTNDYRDGMVQAVLFSNMGYVKFHGDEVDDSLDNIHSCGVMMGDCEPAGTFYHLALVRHGSSFQIIDPWPTSWYGGIWLQSIPRDIVLGKTIGEAYVHGISQVGILYITDPPQWWWDLMENVCFYGDPDLRIIVPDTKYSDANYWEKEDTLPMEYNEEININGHMPYGATSYPNAKQKITVWQKYLPIIVILIIVLILIAFLAIGRRRR